MITRRAPFDLMVRSMDPRCVLFKDADTRAEYFLDLTRAAIRETGAWVGIGPVDYKTGYVSLRGERADLDLVRDKVREALFYERCAVQDFVAMGERLRLSKTDRSLSRAERVERARAYAADVSPVYAKSVERYGAFPDSLSGWVPLAARHAPEIFRKAGVNPWLGCYVAERREPRPFAPTRQQSFMDWAFDRARAVTAQVGGSARLTLADGPL